MTNSPPLFANTSPTFSLLGSFIIIKGLGFRGGCKSCGDELEDFTLLENKESGDVCICLPSKDS